MSLFQALAKVDALAAGRAQPIACVRHVHLDDRPLVLVPVALAGEAAAPLAMMLGTDRAEPVLLVVPQPRDRALRAEFFERLTQVVTGFVGDLGGHVADDAPTDGAESVSELAGGLPDVQVVVPNRAGVDFLRLLGRATRFRDGDRIGRWLTFLADRAEHPDSCLLVAATEALTDHWATGQSSVEDAHLAGVLGWIDGRPGDEDLTAGPTTDPDFDNHTLAPLVDAYDGGDPGAVAQIEKALHGLLEPVWAQVWHAIDLLRALPEARSVPERWLWDVSEYAGFLAQHAPQPIRDSPVAAAARLDRLERTQARVEAQRAFDDPLVMAGYQLTGAAFRGTVVATEPERKEGRKLRPRITVATDRPVHLSGTVTSPTRRAQAAEITEIDGLNVVLTLTSGMGRGAVPAAGSVPEVGEELVYTSLSEAFQRSAAFPDETPWTHGG
ncbi:hypothetical protein Lfu02_14500 [Longispora fulva]|uniref:Uncharacterized protein n=1 Tax=Longispora fulva TaxID=619741 RepID=A0A8J7KMI8_9ACTN|nr:hypothetical protein [Longispora fulva]MBG6140539.1 hypothetical protein [Longispora fulva]GIG57078.1 hypothetical protein Lfu02_14500 [Longispora fulva]